MSNAVVMIDISRIVHDTSLQCRVAMDEDHIAEMAEHLDDTPPVRLYPEHTSGEPPKYYIGDGWHRKIAHERAGRMIIRATLHEGGREGALLWAVRANREHGVKRTQADKQKAIAVYLTHKDWYTHSDPVVAKAVLVDPKTVASARAALELAGTIPTALMRLGADGKLQPAKKQVGNSQPQDELFAIPKPDITPKSSAVKPCKRDGCPSSAWGDSEHCERHSLQISTPEQRTGPALFDQAEAKYKPSFQEAKQEDPSLPSLQSPSGSASPVAPSMGSEVEASVNAALLKSGPLDPKTLLPASQSNGGVESSTPPRKEPGYQHWNTPAWLLDLVRKVNRIALDPFSNQWSLVKADHSFTKEQDGFSCDWTKLSAGGLVYVNPPYDDPMPVAQRAYDEAKKGAEIILCLPSSHSTKWYKFLRRWCQGFVTLDRKVDFGREGVFGSTAYHETTLFYFGSKVARFAAVFGADEVGFFVERLAYVAPPDSRQGELPILEAPRELPRTCPNCGDGDVPEGICDECALDGISCAVCFADITDLSTAKIMTPAGRTINATWSCAKHDTKEETPTPIERPADVIECKRCKEKIQAADSWIAGADPGPFCEQCARLLCGQREATPYLESARARKKTTPEASGVTAKLDTCTSQEEYTPLWHHLLSEHRGGSKEHGAILSHYNKHFFALPKYTNTKESKLHKLLKELGKEYQLSGYEVVIYQPGSNKTKSIMGTLASLKNQDVLAFAPEKDESMDAWIVRFETLEKKALCSLHAIKKEATPKPPTTTEASDPGPWIARSLNQLRACTTREEFDALYNGIMEKASDEEVLSIVDDVTELRAKLPSAANVKPKDLIKTKNEYLCLHCSEPFSLVSSLSSHNKKMHGGLGSLCTLTYEKEFSETKIQTIGGNIPWEAFCKSLKVPENHNNITVDFGPSYSQSKDKCIFLNKSEHRVRTSSHCESCFFFRDEKNQCVNKNCPSKTDKCSQCSETKNLEDCGPVMGKRCKKHLPSFAKKSTKAPRPTRVKGKTEEKKKARGR